MAGASFRYVHDLDELSRIAGPLYSNYAETLERVAALTLWGTAYRYPSGDPLDNDPPDMAEIAAALSDIETLAAALARAVEG